MGFIDLFGKKKRYVDERNYEANLERQEQMNSSTLSELGKYGITDEKHLSLEFFFYSDKPENAKALAENLKGLNYRIETAGPSAANKRIWCVSGWTTKIRMNLPSVTGWAKQMCALGYELDCDFDGWGTNPQQD